MASIVDEIKLKHSTLVLYSNTILEIYLDDHFFYTIKEGLEIEIAIEELCQKSELRVILLAGLYSDCDTETRKFIASNSICDKITSMALITRSLAQDLLANFIIAYDKPSKPARVFRSKEKALKWILEIE